MFTWTLVLTKPLPVVLLRVDTYYRLELGPGACGVVRATALGKRDYHVGPRRVWGGVWTPFGNNPSTRWAQARVGWCAAGPWRWQHGRLGPGACGVVWIRLLGPGVCGVVRWRQALVALADVGPRRVRGGVCSARSTISCRRWAQARVGWWSARRTVMLSAQLGPGACRVVPRSALFHCSCFVGPRRV